VTGGTRVWVWFDPTRPDAVLDVLDKVTQLLHFFLVSRHTVFGSKDTGIFGSFERSFWVSASAGGHTVSRCPKCGGVVGWFGRVDPTTADTLGKFIPHLLLSIKGHRNSGAHGALQ
jgi:hypothetical protein